MLNFCMMFGLNNNEIRVIKRHKYIYVFPFLAILPLVLHWRWLVAGVGTDGLVR